MCRKMTKNCFYCNKTCLSQYLGQKFLLLSMVLIDSNKLYFVVDLRTVA